VIRRRRFFECVAAIPHIRTYISAVQKRTCCLSPGASLFVRLRHRCSRTLGRLSAATTIRSFRKRMLDSADTIRRANGVFERKTIFGKIIFETENQSNITIYSYQSVKPAIPCTANVCRLFCPSELSKSSYIQNFELCNCNSGGKHATNDNFSHSGRAGNPPP
jgi:hypothetical protein